MRFFSKHLCTTAIAHYVSVEPMCSCECGREDKIFKKLLVEGNGWREWEMERRQGGWGKDNQAVVGANAEQCSHTHHTRVTGQDEFVDDRTHPPAAFQSHPLAPLCIVAALKCSCDYPPCTLDHYHLCSHWRLE